MAASLNQQYALASQMMSALNRAVITAANGGPGLIATGSFPFADAAAFIAAGVAVVPASPLQFEEQIRLFTGKDAEFKVFNAAGMLTSVAQAATLAAARTAVRVFNSNVPATQMASHLTD